jgi:hypothetical protein
MPPRRPTPPPQPEIKHFTPDEIEQGIRKLKRRIEEVMALAEYCGTSLTMIEKHYGRYIRNDAREQLALNRRRAPETARERIQRLREQARASRPRGDEPDPQ